ncbi:hypothetical protein [uncultured Alistipes sp.]|jgi:hypothetical protein|uniref:hypothetical protein n=1 Tax=Alistipes TaxID=239759 RepID=UPI00266C49B3|nr:hypothetical protein [uncultured Alistipes sp.]
MIPIPLEDFSSLNIRNKLLELSELYKDEVATFAVLLNDSKDYLINRIIKDDAMWSALHHISGRYLHIFYFDIDENRRRAERLKHEKEQRDRQRRYKEERGMMSMMIAVQRDELPDDSIEMLKLILNENIRPPALLFFQTSGKSIDEHFVINIKKEEAEPAFIEIKNIIERAVETIKSDAVRPSADFFSQLEASIRVSRFWDYIKGHFSFSFGPISFNL